MVSGPAVVAALARELEAGHGHAEFHPARLTVDLFAPVRFVPLRVRTRSVREGNRIRVADAEVLQGPDAVVARATLPPDPPGRAATGPGLASRSHEGAATAAFRGTPRRR